jgi:hypothetical protein
MALWNDDETKALDDAFGVVAFLDKANLAAELIPAIKRYANGQVQPSLDHFKGVCHAVNPE